MPQRIPIILLANAVLAPLAPQESTLITPATPPTLSREIRKGIEILERIHTPVTAWNARQELRLYHRQLKALLARLPWHSGFSDQSDLHRLVQTYRRTSTRILAIPQVHSTLSPELTPILQTLERIPKTLLEAA